MIYDNYTGISTEIALLGQSKAIPTMMNPPPFGLPMAHPPWLGADNYTIAAIAASTRTAAPRLAFPALPSVVIASMHLFLLVLPPSLRRN
jgi:hypothetical protein